MPINSDERTISAQQHAYRYIRERILSGSLPGGALVNASTIAKEIGVSRIPVREALRELDAEGLIQIRLNRSAVVTQLTPSEVRELFEMRAVLEALATRIALEHLDDDHRDELEMRRRQMDRARDDVKLWTVRHQAFHDFLCGQSQRPRLVAEITHLREAVQPYLLLYIGVYGTTEMPGFEHETLLSAIDSGNPGLVEIAVRNHIMSAAEGVITFLEQRMRNSPETASSDRPAGAASSAKGLESGRLEY